MKKLYFIYLTLLSEIPYKIPAGLEDNTTKKRKRKTEIKKELPPINVVVEKCKYP